MKLSHSTNKPFARRHRERGLATVFAIAVIGIFCAVLLANAESVKRSFKEVRRVEQRQLKHSPWLMTNQVPSTADSK